ncbi:c-type cytochrome [Methylocaldum gracile]
MFTLRQRRLIDAMKGSLLTLLAVHSCVASAAATPTQTIGINLGMVEWGKRIYREGVLPSGRPLRALVQDDVTLTGSRAACVNCHGRSGFGSGEGQAVARPITGPSLYNPAYPPHPKMHGSGSQSALSRPAYTDETLATALRTGIDMTGRRLNPPMPRYTLTRTESDALIAYLKTLSTAPSPGVNDQTIHFATVATQDAEPTKQKAMLDVLEAFFRNKNAETRRETLRAERAPWDMEREYKAYRKWRLHLWTLTGRPETWRAQLEAYYRTQPVFALLSGIGAGAWQPVHDFCERHEVPCLFPNVDFPVFSENGYYAFYFSRGVTLEADVLARHLSEASERSLPGPIVQIFRNDKTGRIPADAFRKAMKANGNARVRDVGLDPAAKPTADFWRTFLKREHPALLVLWLRDSDLSGLESLAASVLAPDRIYLSSTLSNKASSFLAADSRTKIRFVYPFELPEALDRRLLRLKAWLKRRKLEPIDERVQANTYFAVTKAGAALMHMVDHFSRDYFVEKIEHEVDTTIATSVYPHLSLGTGRRFGSNGAYLVEPDVERNETLVPVSRWIVP